MTTLASGPSVSLRRRGAPAVNAVASALPSLAGNSSSLHTSSDASGSSSAAAASTSASAFGWKGITEQDVSEKGTKNVVVLGGSYGGMHAASVLAQRLPPSHRVILIERNSHFNHLYVFPRFSVLPGHEHKAFVPYTSIFKDAPGRPKVGSARAKAAQAAAAAAAAAAGKGKEVHDQEDAPAASRRKLDRGVTPRMTEFGGATPSTATPKSEDLIGMGSLSGPARDDVPRPSSETRSASPSTSSSFASSADDSALHNAASHDSLTSAGGYSSRSKDDVVPDPGNRAAERAIADDGQAAGAEEKLGRPPVVVEDLAEALERGLDLEGRASSDAPASDEDGDVSPGFEDAHPHIVLQASVTRITDSHVVVEPSVRPGFSSSSSSAKAGKLWSIDSVSIPYTHLIYALGSHLPDPLRTEARTKKEGTNWMRAIQRRIASSREIVIVGGGALGVEFATDIKSLHKGKDVTLIHSRKQLLPNFDPRVHEHAMRRLEELGVRVVLGERLALAEGCPRGSSVQPSTSSTAAAAVTPPTLKVGQTTTKGATTLAPGGTFCKPGDGLGEGAQAHQEGVCLGDGRKLIRTTAGKEFECDLLLLCTGQQPNSALMAQLSPSSVDPSTRLVRVLPTLQVALPDPKEAAQMPFDAKPPCGDCDCFLDKKAAGAELSTEQDHHLKQHGVDEDDDSRSRPGRLHNVYAIGDVAHAFGALNAGYQAWAMADVAAENVIRDIGASVDPRPSSPSSSSPSSSSRPCTPLRREAPEMLRFSPAPNYLKLSLGLGTMVYQGSRVVDEKSGRTEATVEDKEDPEDLAVEGVWSFMAKHSTEDLYL